MEIAGLPLHPLAVHAALVFVPITMVASVVVCFWPAARRRYGSLTWGVGVVTVVAVAVATASGDSLRDTMAATPPIINDHELYGSSLIYPCIAVIVGLGLLLVSDWLRGRADDEPDPPVIHARARALRLLGIVIVVMAAAMGLTLVVLTGHSGATAVWGA